MFKTKFVVCSLLWVFMFGAIYGQYSEQLLKEADGLQRVSGSAVGKNSQPSPEFMLFETIGKLTTNEVVQLFQTTVNPIAKLFCFWALKERKYQNSMIYGEYLKNLYTDLKIETQWYGTSVTYDQFMRLVDYDFRKYWSGKP